MTYLREHNASGDTSLDVLFHKSLEKINKNIQNVQIASMFNLVKPRKKEMNINDGSIEIQLGLSACLAGDKVRYNGQGSESKFITFGLSKYFQFVKICPEVEIGMGIPRETIRIVDDNGLKLQNKNGSKDYTDQMLEYSRDKVKGKQLESLSGFIFKKGSPSCGAFRVKAYNKNGGLIHNKTVGFFADAFKRKFPYIPVEEDGRLNDATIRHNFLSRVFAYKRWQLIIGDKPTARGLVKYHSIHKYMLMSYSQTGLKELGRIVANHDKRDIVEVCQEYLFKFAELTQKPATRAKHSNVLYHIFGYFSRFLDEFDRHEAVRQIEKYRNGFIPLVLPIMTLKHYARKHEIDYILGQSYISYPEELGLLNAL